jgi:hypothetical protein
MTPSDFLADFFQHSTGSIYLCSLPNERGKSRPAEICGRGAAARLDELVIHGWDRPDRGSFFCVNTLEPKQAVRSKETVLEIVALHADLDFEKIDMEPGAILRQLKGLEFQPSKVVSSGHGFHAYWLLTEALPASSEIVAQTEIALHGLANMLGGDPAVCEVARLMRVPGSFNTKNGERLPVTVTVDSDRRYELGDLVQWVAETSPLESPASNPFLHVALPGGGGPAVDIEGRLAAMAYQGAGDASIHQTQVSVSAAMLNRGTPADEVVQAVLDATRKAAGTAGERWNWAREEKDIRRMCETWARKKNGGTEPLKRRGVSMEALGVMDFKPVEFLVDGLIPREGVTLICSKPKVGKSWFLFDLCLSCAMGRMVLDDRRVAQGHTLYLALEDSLRRLRSRGEKLLAGHFASWPANAVVETTWGRVDQGRLDHLRDWISDVHANGGNVACVAIDVLKMIRPAGQEKKTVYDRDYESLTGLRALSHELGVAFIVSHHTRKTASDDLLDLVSGTLGLSGSADTVIVIDRQAGDGFVFDVRGRDVEAQQLAAIFDRETCRWRITGEAGAIRRSESKRLIEEVLRSVPEGLSPAEIGADTGLKANTVRVTLLRMLREGEVRKSGGKYRLSV